MWVLAQDGAPCHTANSTQIDILTQAADILPWPGASPDLNPIEHVWHALKLEVYRRAPRNEEELRQFILEEWANLDNNEVTRMAESFERRLEMVIEAEGEYRELL